MTPKTPNQVLTEAKQIFSECAFTEEHGHYTVVSALTRLLAYDSEYRNTWDYGLFARETGALVAYGYIRYYEYYRIPQGAQSLLSDNGLHAVIHDKEGLEELLRILELVDVQ